MGYRQYFYKLSNDLIEKIRHCQTETEFVGLIKAEKPNAVEEYGGETYVPLYDLGSYVYEFGKYYGNSDEMYKHGDSLFCSDELNEQYEYYGAIVVGRSGVKCAIDFYREKVKKLYADLLQEQSSEEWDTRSQLDRLKAHAQDYLGWWEAEPADLDLTHERIVSSWLYEHEYFELVRIYKTFDFDAYSLVFMGW